MVKGAESEPPERGIRRVLRRRKLTRVKSLARAHTAAAIATLAKIMLDGDAPPFARVSAANALLNRGWGKPHLPLPADESSPIQLIQKIERTIVYPQHPALALNLMSEHTALQEPSGSVAATNTQERLQITDFNALDHS